ncbi:CobW family GTP-binding protein [Paraburkholderia fungorum]|uniref:CobW family GTP-binding protein n=1 Tax=Paraburkholderia fungorum TaxID=134537 RepID=UPI0038B74D74
MKAQPAQFVVLAGMLGSGKTSLLEAWLREADASASTAIVVNEVGAINIDGAVLSESARGTQMATLSNGCVCCSLNDDLVTTVEDLVATRAQAAMPPFERIVLECSGLSKPGQVIQALNPLSAMGLRVHIVATYDCSRPPLGTEEFNNVAAQLGAAHTIVLTKTDLVDAQRTKLAAAIVTKLNPFARIVDTETIDARAREAFREMEVDRPLDGSLTITPGIERRALLHPRIRIFCARFSHQPNWEETLDWLENISGAMGDRLLRMKAIVAGPAGDDRVLLQSVGTTFAAPRRLVGQNAADFAAIFIVRDCAMYELEEVQMDTPVRWSSLQR